MVGENGSTEVLHIHELRGDNFKRLKHFAVKLQPGVTQVTGKNGAGKSTFLDVVKHLLGDAKQHSAEVIRRGEESCQLVGDLGDFIVERRWTKTEKGELQTVVLKAKDGTRLKSPQAILDSFYNTYTFDPLAFMRLEPKKQLEELKALVGVNTGPLDGKRQDLYEQRTDVNRRRTDRGARLKAMPTPPAEIPTEPVNVDELLAEQNRLFKLRGENDKLRSLAERLTAAKFERERQVRDQVENVRRARAALEAAEAELVRREDALKLSAKEEANALEAVAGLVDPVLGDLTAKISAAQTTNLWVAKMKDRAALEAELKKLDEEEAQLTAAIASIDAEKAKLIAEAKFPVPGLGFGDGVVLLNSFPLPQASSAEKMRVSTAMGFARHPRLKFMAIHDGSLLDDDSLALLEKLCAEHGGQLLIERVGASSDVGVLIEDGEVVPVRAVKGGQGDLGIVLEGRGPGGAA